MFRSLFTVLAVLALIASVSAQSNNGSSSSASPRPSSSSSSAFPSKLSSSSSYLPANASTGGNNNGGGGASFMTSSSSSGFPANTYSISFEVVFAYAITVANINATAISIQGDIVYNLAQLSGFSNTSLSSSVVVTSVNGTATGFTGPTSRRLLQTPTYPGGVTFILLGSIVNALPSFNPSTVVSAFVTAAANGNLKTVYTNATIPVQHVAIAAVGPVSSSTGYNGAASAASAGAALLFAVVASLALLL